MQFIKILVLLSSALFVISCSSTKPPEIEVSASKELTHKGFQFSISENEGWSVVKSSPYKVFLAKRGAEESEYYTLQILVVSLPSFINDNEFLEYIRTNMNKTPDKSATNVLNQSANMISGQDGMCVQYSSKKEKQNTGNNALKDGSMFLEMINFTCHHPYNTNAGIYMAYSKSYYLAKDEDLNAQAVELFNRLSFTEL